MEGGQTSVEFEVDEMAGWGGCVAFGPGPTGLGGCGVPLEGRMLGVTAWPLAASVRGWDPA